MALTGCGEEPKKTPNIIFIVADTLRADYLGTYGFGPEASPHIDRLASESLIFDRAYSHAPWTQPSIATMFTSLHPQTHCIHCEDPDFCVDDPGKRQFQDVLSPEAITMAEIFRRAGYETAGFIGNFVLLDKWGFGQGFDTYVTPSGVEEGHISDGRVVLARSLKWLEERQAKEKPFFLYIHLVDVHGGYKYYEEDFQYLKQFPPLNRSRALTKEEEEKLGYLRYTFPLSSPLRHDLSNWKTAYAAALLRMDRALGSFRKDVERLGLWDDAVVLFTSDHGEEFLDHGKWGHNHSHFEEMIRVPLFIRLPGERYAGRRIPSLVGLIDILPTLMSYTKVGPPLSHLQGKDFSFLLNGGIGEVNDWIFATSIQALPKAITARSKRFKVIWDRPGWRRLFDLKIDPGETANLAYKHRPKQAREIMDVIEAHLSRLESAPRLPRKTLAITKEQEEALRSLGYVQ